MTGGGEGGGEGTFGGGDAALVGGGEGAGVVGLVTAGLGMARGGVVGLLGAVMRIFLVILSPPFYAQDSDAGPKRKDTAGVRNDPRDNYDLQLIEMRVKIPRIIPLFRFR